MATTGDQRPRERLLRHGAGALLDAELLALVLGTGSRTASAFAIALALLARFGDLLRLATAGVAELAAVPGVGFAQACRLKAALTLAGRVAERPFSRGDPFTSTADVARRVGRGLLGLEREVLVVLALDVKNRVLTEARLAEGSVCTVDIVPRDAFTFAVREGAVGLIFVHNHPSGDPTPSADDVAFTERLREVGQIIGVQVLDHIVVARTGYRSLLHGQGGAW